MKTLKKAFITLISLLGLSLTSCTFYGTYPDANKYVVGDKTYTGELQELDIDWVSGELTLIQDETSENIIIKEESDEELTEEKQVHSYFNDGVLKIQYCESGYKSFGFRSMRKHLFVTFASVDEINIDLTSGKFTAEKLDAKDIDIDLTSGTVNLGTVKCEELKVDQTSGTTTIDSLDCNSADFDLTSGNIKIKESKASTLDFELTSGKIDLKIPEDGATISFKKTSGSYQSERKDYMISPQGEYVYGDGSCKIKIRLTSGKAIIR